MSITKKYILTPYTWFYPTLVTIPQHGFSRHTHQRVSATRITEV